MLNRKLLRDLARSRWQYIAIGAMVMLGVTFFNASYAAYVNLDASYKSSYSTLRFEDFGIQMTGAPERVVERLGRIPGIDAVEGRLIEDVALEVPKSGLGKKLVGRLISIPVESALTVDELKLVEGAQLRSATSREVLIEASFAKYHDLHRGDMVVVSRGNSRARLTIAGVVQSAEYLYVVRSKHELMAMPDTFGVMFVSRDLLGMLVAKPAQLNDVRFRVSDPTRVDSAMREAAAMLEPYGVIEPVRREDQPSFQMLEQDVEGFRMYAILFPAFFLSVATVAVYSLLQRMVHQQRPVIGLLRSLGFSSGAVVRHYLAVTLVMGSIGSLLGSVLGVVMAGWASRLYMSQLQVPVYEIVVRWPVIAVGYAIGVAACLVGGLFPAKAAAKIKPAEAMRPVAPTYGRHALQLDRLFPNARLVTKIPLRNVFRQPRRTISSLFGIISGMALMMTARGLLDSTNVAIDTLVSGSYQYDLRLDFIRFQTTADVARVSSWPGVAKAEGVLELPVDLRHGDQTYSALISGQGEGSSLLQLQDSNGDPIQVPTGRADYPLALFGQVLQKRLGLEVGDLVEVKISEQATKEDSTKRFVRVAGFTKEAIGTIAYLSHAHAVSLFRKDMELPHNAISGIVLQVDPPAIQEVRKRLYAMTDAGSVLSIPEIRALIVRMMSSVNSFVLIMEAFGAALAFAMVFNMISINVLERTAEVATLRTIGMSHGSIARMITLENLIVTLIGIAIGLPFGKWFLLQFWQAAQTPEQQDLFTFEVAMAPATYVIAAILILVIAVVSQVPALRMLGRQSLAQATKERSH